jgi:hypothetical protein
LILTGLAVGVVLSLLGFSAAAVALAAGVPAALGTVTLYGASVLAGQDPIDHNYTVVAAPTPPPVPTLPTTPLITPATYAVINDYLQNATQVIGLANAIQTALNRANGAYSDNVPTFETLQLNAENSFFTTEQNDLNNMGNELITLGTGLESLFDPYLSAADFLEYQRTLATQGFSVSETAMLEGLGASPTDIISIISAVDSLDPNSLAGSYPSELALFGSQLVAATAVPELSSLMILFVGLVGLSCWCALRNMEFPDEGPTEWQFKSEDRL